MASLMFPWIYPNASHRPFLEAFFEGSKQPWAFPRFQIEAKFGHASWTMFRYLEATAVLLGAKFGDLVGRLGYREVILARSWGQVLPLCGAMLKLSWAMLLLGHVECVRFCSAMLLALRPKMPGPRF